MCGLVAGVSLPPSIVSSSAAKLGIKLHHGTMQTLGVLVGFGAQQWADWLKEVVDSYQPYLDLLLHNELPAQVAMLLIRLSVIPQLGYLSRVVPPTILAPHARRFDGMVMDVVVRKFALQN